MALALCTNNFVSLLSSLVNGGGKEIKMNTDALGRQKGRLATPILFSRGLQEF
jgi:hypothetical protein